MKITPKILLGVAGIGLLTTLLFFSKIQAPAKNSLTLTSEVNKFKINFQIDPKNLKDFEAVLTSLNIPTAGKDGFEFELDSTSSARLAFLAPVKSSINFAPKNFTVEM